MEQSRCSFVKWYSSSWNQSGSQVYIVCKLMFRYIYICISVDEASKSSHLFTEIYDNIPDDSRNNDVAVERIITLWRF